jgi:hypothetical protein
VNTSRKPQAGGPSLVGCPLLLIQYGIVSKIFWTDALPRSTQLRATWRTDSLDMVVLPSAGASRYHNCIDSGTSPEYFGYRLVYLQILKSDWLWAGRSADRFPLGAIFFAHVQTGPGVHPASCTMGTGFFPGVKRLGRGVDHPPLLAPR